MLGVPAQFGVVQLPDVQWSLLWPLLILALGGIVLITITSLVSSLRTNGFPAIFTALCALLAGLSLIWVDDRIGRPGVPARVVGGALAVDHYTIFVTGLIVLAVFFAALVLDDYLRREGLDGPEWYALILLSAAGGVLLATASDLIVAFVGLEILSIAVYVLAALHLRRTESQEAGFKYFILGALSSAIFLYGIAMIYGAIGSTSYDAIAAVLGLGPTGAVNPAGLSPGSESSLLLLGMALLVVGFAFKVSAVPFHFWTPDVYQGSPTPIVGFMASAVKVSALAGFARLFIVAFGGSGEDWRPLVAALGVLSVILGSALAIVQHDVKRMLAYSSIAHAGFMLIGLHAAGSPVVQVSLDGGRAVLFYLLAYTAMASGTFAVITVIGRRGDGAHDLRDYRGLARKQPVLAALLVVLLFSQAGVPFTAGFFAKFTVILAAADGEEYVLAGVAMLAAVVGAYLYLRIVVAMYLIGDADTPASEAGADALPADPAGAETTTDAVTVGTNVFGYTDVETAPVATLESAPPAQDLETVTAPSPVLVAAGLAVAITLVLGVFPGLVETPLMNGVRALLGG